MFEKLKQRWKVNGLNLLLIITTFALGGSLCGYAGRKILMLTGLDKGVLWIILYVLLITLLWPVCVLIISIPLGQFSFFRKYLIKVWGKISGKNPEAAITRIAIFASGAGSNAQQIINYFSNAKNIQVALIVCNKPGAGVLAIAKNAGIPVLLVEKEKFFDENSYWVEIGQYRIDLIVLAGFLWKIPVKLIKAYPGKIINIHPALLPKYGGKGMYGHHVHEAVIAAGDTQSGITIHYVDEIYDHGQIIFQASCEVTATDTAASLAQKIHALEHAHYPAVIDELIKKQNRS